MLNTKILELSHFYTLMKCVALGSLWVTSAQKKNSLAYFFKRAMQMYIGAREMQGGGYHWRQPFLPQSHDNDDFFDGSSIAWCVPKYT